VVSSSLNSACGRSESISVLWLLRYLSFCFKYPTTFDSSTTGVVGIVRSDRMSQSSGWSDPFSHVTQAKQSRDPWWVFTCLVLFHVVRKCYGTGVIELVKRSPRFGILLLAIFLSTVFTICDIIASATPLITVSKGGTDG
jgi:hypothetical protein